VSPTAGPTPARRLGDRGEGHARRFLEGKGYVFVAANWRCPAGELDLVMRDGGEVVVVEVKTRRGEGMGRAEEAISPAKARRLLAAGEWYLAQAPEPAEAIWRVDLVAITLDRSGAVERLTHVVNAIGVG
jgi:putative endonuclease